MQTLRRAAILGVGLIGGSLGLRWRQQGVVDRVVGFGRTRAHLERAVELGAVDEIAADLPEALRGADLVVLAAPVGTCLQLGPRVAALADPASLITDVGSTKKALALIMAEALKARGQGAPHFIGGHPMAGAERAGVEAADPLLFEQAVWALCPAAGTPEDVLGRMVALVEATGAHPLLLDPEQHDRRVAAVSHLPQLAAVALAEAAGLAAQEDPELLAMAGGGFRDTTRIAQSPASMWLDVLATNREAVLEQMDALAALLDHMRAALADEDQDAIREHFARAAAVRQRVPARQKGLLPRYHDLVLYVPDRPGVIGALCLALGERQINVQDIEILRLREGEGGTLRLGFARDDLAQAALGVLTDLGYRAQQR